MGKLIFLVALWAASFGFVSPQAQAQNNDEASAILNVVPAPTAIIPDQRLWDANFPSDRGALLTAIDYSLTYIDSPAAAKAYQNYPIPGITQQRVKRSLLRFRELAAIAPNATSFQASLMAEFDFYQASGQDGLGTVKFTGYYEPIYEGSRVRTAEFKYPVYRTPWNLKRWGQTQPRRIDIEGADGLGGARGPAKGYELVWLNSRLDAYLLQVQGSGRIKFADGSIMSVGYDADNGYPYTSLGKALVEDGVIDADKISLPAIMDYFELYPEAMDSYLPRNDRFIFFRETNGLPPMGSLGYPVTAERSIATDKSLMPPGAIAMFQTSLPYLNNLTQTFEEIPVTRYVLDQDTGSAIKGPGRVDIFLGTGEMAGDRAGLIDTPGQLYYLLLK